jgi:hypothetical protein
MNVFILFLFCWMIIAIFDGSWNAGDFGSAWFLFGFTLWLLAARLLRHFPAKIVLPAIVVLYMFYTYSDRSSMIHHWFLPRIIFYLPIFMLGFYLPTNWLEKLENTKWRYLSVPALAAIVAVAWFALKDVGILFVVHECVNVFLGQEYGAARPLLALLEYALVAICSFTVLMIAPRRKIPFASELGKRTLQIFFYQYALWKLWGRLDPQHKLVEYLGQWLFIVLALVLGVLLSLKPFGYPILLIGKLGDLLLRGGHAAAVYCSLLPSQYRKWVNQRSNKKHKKRK